MTGWWHDDEAPWRSELAALLFPGCEDQGRPDVDWTALEDIVDAHRLSPWLHARGAEAPPPLQERWQADARIAAVRSLQMQQDLADLIDVLGSHGIDVIALKGLPLSLLCYDQPWHRPMRDLDLLIEERGALLHAWTLMLEAEYTPYLETVGDPEAILDERHQLPPLLSPTHATPVELHQRAGHSDSEPQPMPTHHCALLGREIRVPTPEVLLVQLVRHAARDHRFDNGPQVLVDIAKLLENIAIDLREARTLAAREGLGRHLSLLWSMAVDAFPDLESPPDDPIAYDDAKRLAWRLMTSDPDALGAARDRQSTASAGASHWLARLFPSPRRLRASQGEGFFLLQYLAHYRRLATERAPRMLRKSEMDGDLRTMVGWLGD